MLGVISLNVQLLLQRQVLLMTILNDAELFRIMIVIIFIKD